MFCPKCGKENDDGAQFCARCGEKLNASQDTQKAPEASTATTEAVATTESSTAVAANKNGRVLGIVVAAVVIVAVVIAGFATNWFGLTSVQSNTPAETESTGQESAVSQITETDNGEQGSLESALEAYSWQELSNISSEIAKASDEDSAIEVAKRYNLCTPDGKLDGTQEKSVTLSDGTETAVQIAGFCHDNKTDGGKAGITFIFRDAIAEHEMNSDYTNAGGWKDSQMRKWLSSSVFGMLPEELQNQIVAVDKLTNNEGETTSVSSVTTTSDRFWLYSSTELCGSIDWYFDTVYNKILNAEGSEYKLFRDSNVDRTSEDIAILTKNFQGYDGAWWERSPNPGYSDAFLFVYTDEDPIGIGGAGHANSVVPGFCI